MTSLFAKLAFGAVAALALGGAAQATEISITVRAGDQASYRSSADFDRYSEDDGYGRSHRRGEYRDFRREQDRFDDRRAHDWTPTSRPVFARPGWGRHHDDCRLIVKRRVNPWGDLVIKRIRICD